MQLRIRDLGLTIEGTPLETQLHDLYELLQRRGILALPHVWLSEEWFSPQGIPGFALPFYLAHPRLVRLERSMLGFAEGDDFGRDAVRAKVGDQPLR